jgi:hypothetical protein
LTHKDRIPPDENGQSQEQKLQSMISALWDRSRHTVVERAALLRTAGDLLAHNRLDEATFGLPRGTDLAREAEVLFGRSGKPGKMEIERLQVLLAELTHLIDRGPLGPS